MVSIEGYRLMDVIDQISEAMTYEPDITGTYLEHAIFDRKTAAWIVSFRQIPSKQGRYHPPLQFTYALDEMSATERYLYNLSYG